MTADILQGDEIVLMRQRRVTRKDDKGQDVEVLDTETLSVVRVPQDFTILGGGTLAPEYAANDKSEARDRQYLVVRWPIRLK